ncbi:unnamed protein product [Vitrella brassicaformis CCMP3155]|uniref:Uncharacterized protein n=1 Tax=Vitrella brassicaformis (strain CCMP3155) TaxID=1169540 RepID=A0A0G4GL27_VITBC|nr:unnamed protein product [Vitrella brassicaformis CCMP3155]|eukprot:CEM30734.1 unnamed protein product [Vitrella brassicaformis CCMP3155]
MQTGSNALHLAAFDGRLAAVKQLLEWDPKLVDARTKSGWWGPGATPFIYAAVNGHVEVLKVLYAKGGEDLLTQTDKFGRTALHKAVSYSRSAVVSLLLEWGGSALLDIKDKIGKTPWDEAASKPEIREIMVKYK